MEKRGKMGQTRESLTDYSAWTGRDVPLVLGEARVDADRGEVAVLEKLVELRRSLDRLDEDADLRQTSRDDPSAEDSHCRLKPEAKTHLVELERVKQLVQLPVLLLLLELDVVLLQTVQRQLGLVVDVDLQRLYTISHQPTKAFVSALVS